MSWWEFRRLGLVVLAIDAAGAIVALGASRVIGGWSATSISLWMVGISFALLLCAGGAPAAIPMGRMDNKSNWSRTSENEMLAERLNHNRLESGKGPLSLSYGLAIALAGIPLLIASGLVTMVW